MRSWRIRLARGAWLAAAVGILFAFAFDAYGRRVLRNPSDRELAAFFRAHRAEFEELLRVEREHSRAVARATPAAREAGLSTRLRESDPRFQRLMDGLGLVGGEFVWSESLIYIPKAAWYPREIRDDVKGYVYSTAPLANLAEDLDRVVVPPRRPPEVLTWHRALDGPWYLYREVGGRAFQ